ncbi:MAG: hypothetical protein HC831_03530 [Chloroflexia bacterium]|nr:hypothetical protein [Chloroflexia bacterium]
MSITRKIKRISLKLLLSILGLMLLFAFYSNSLIGVNKKSIDYYISLKETVKSKGYEDRMYVISGKRFKFYNSFLVKYGNAVSTSRHLKGEAIDILVLDINNDGTADSKDVDLIYNILDKEIVKKQGGIGTYKNQSGFFTRQMVHFDCRGYWARWEK